MIRYFTILFLFSLIYFQGKGQSIENVDFHKESEHIVVNYNLIGDGSFDISLLYTFDDFNWQSVPISTCTGDIGSDVKPNNKLEIIWQPLLHLDKLEGNIRVMIRVFYKPKEQVKLPEMVFIQGATFNMGSNDRNEREKPSHSVKISNFYMSKYEITVREFKQFIEETHYQTDAEKNGGTLTSSSLGTWELKDGLNWRFDAVGNLYEENKQNYPVINVSWNDAIAYCEWLSKKTGKIYRLPSEAEWEYAAGNGVSHHKFSWGDSYPIGKNGGNLLDETAINRLRLKKDKKMQFVGYDDGFLHPSPVGSFTENTFGLHDMTGNVWEWCQDSFDENFYGKSPLSDPINTQNNIQKVLRGGSWNSFIKFSCTTTRTFSKASDRSIIYGFRIVNK